MQLSKEERETIIIFNELEDEAVITTFNTKLKNRLRDLQSDDATKLVDEFEDGCVEYRIPKTWVRINPPRKMSEEQMAASAERLRAYRDTQRNDTL